MFCTICILYYKLGNSMVRMRSVIFKWNSLVADVTSYRGRIDDDYDRK